MSKIVSLAPKRPARISSKVREAVRLTVTEGLSIVEACARAGLSREGYRKAMQRPPVREMADEIKRRFVADTEAQRAFYKARALEVALDLMLNATSEAVRARMVEFLASDAKVSPVAVHIDARQAVGGYEFVRPGQKVVDIEGAASKPPGGE